MRNFYSTGEKSLNWPKKKVSKFSKKFRWKKKRKKKWVNSAFLWLVEFNKILWYCAINCASERKKETQIEESDYWRCNFEDLKSQNFDQYEIHGRQFIHLSGRKIAPRMQNIFCNINICELKFIQRKDIWID